MKFVQGRKLINFEYKKEHLDFHSFEVRYQYRHTSSDLFESWVDKRMTGFRLSWVLENTNPQLEIATSEIGRRIQTPGLEGDSFDEQFYTQDQAYMASLLISDQLVESVGNGTLVVQLEINTRDEEGWEEYVEYAEIPKWGLAKYKLYTQKLGWDDADTYCKGVGGHLASIHSDEEHRKVAGIGNGNYIWIGGSTTEKKGVWGWSDGSPWSYTNWQSGEAYTGIEDKCVWISPHTNQWDALGCRGFFSHPFVCQSRNPHIRRGKISFNQEYTKDQLTFSSIEVKYKYHFTRQDLLDSWQDRKMTGFRLNWFLKDSNGSRLTEIMPDLTDQWKHPEVDIPKYQNTILESMVQLARKTRLSNRSGDDIIKEVNHKKKEMTGLLSYTSICSGGQVKKEHQSRILGNMNLGLNIHGPEIITEEDIRTGFMLYSALISCSESVALYHFLHGLLSNQSPRTIIQATVNTIESDNLRERASKTRINQMYLLLDDIFNLQYGKILLATSSPSQLDAMIAKDWPYFSHYSQEINECLGGGSCQGITDIMQQTRGK